MLKTLKRRPFLSDRPLVHPQLGDALTLAEGRFKVHLAEVGLARDYPRIAKSVSTLGFQWRSRDGQPTTFTTHQLGMGIDLNAGRNLNIAGKKGQAADLILDYLHEPLFDDPPDDKSKWLRFRHPLLRDNERTPHLLAHPELRLGREYPRFVAMGNSLIQFTKDTTDQWATLQAEAADQTKTAAERAQAQEQLTLLERFYYYFAGPLRRDEPEYESASQQLRQARFAKGKGEWESRRFESGLVDIPLVLLVACAEEKLTLGLEYSTGKDAMQVEIPLRAKRNYAECLARFQSRRPAGQAR
jgi:hypothetical protein